MFGEEFINPAILTSVKIPDMDNEDIVVEVVDLTGVDEMFLVIISAAGPTTSMYRTLTSISTLS